MQNDDPWRILGLEPGATREEIRAAYRDLAKVWHPDRFSAESPQLQQRATRELQRINEAYAAIGNGAEGQARRSRLDRMAPRGSARRSIHRKVFTLAFWSALVVFLLLALRFGLLFRQAMTTFAMCGLLPALAAATARMIADAALTRLAGGRE